MPGSNGSTVHVHDGLGRRNHLRRQKRQVELSPVEVITSTFLKRPLDSISVHIGKIVDNSTVEQLAKVGLMVLLGLKAYNVAQNRGWDVATTILAGNIGLELALTDGPLSQAAGLLTLGVLGVGSLPTESATPVKPEIPGDSKPPAGSVAVKGALYG